MLVGGFGNLPRADSISLADFIVIFSGTDSTYQASVVSNLITLIEASITTNGRFVKQYASPNANGFSVPMTSDQTDRHLILTPTGTFATGTITLPLAGTTQDGQRVCVTTTQAVTTLTIGANGALTVSGAPTTLAAGAFFTLEYDMPSSAWIRIA